MPKITIDVPAGSRIKVKSGPGVIRTVAYEVAMASQDAKKQRDAERFAKTKWPDRFKVGDLVQQIDTFQSCGRHHHAVVTRVEAPCWNQEISLSYAGEPDGWGVRAEKYEQATYRARRRCECGNCTGWNRLGLLQRWKRRHEAVRGDAT